MESSADQNIFGKFNNHRNDLPHCGFSPAYLLIELHS